MLSCEKRRKGRPARDAFEDMNVFDRMIGEGMMGNGSARRFQLLNPAHYKEVPEFGTLPVSSRRSARDKPPGDDACA